MNRRPAIAIIAGSVCAGIVCAFVVSSAVASDEKDTATALPTPSTTTPKTPTPEASTPAPSTKPSAPTPAGSTDFSIDNLVDSNDLAEIGYPVDPQGVDRGPGDLAYASSPCMQKGMADESGAPVFSGSWVGRAGTVDVSVTEAASPEVANNVGVRIETDHSDTCVDNGNAISVKERKRTELEDGFRSYFDVVVPANDPKSFTGRVGVVVVGNRVAFVWVATTGNSLAAFNELLDRVTERLR